MVERKSKRAGLRAALALTAALGGSCGLRASQRPPEPEQRPPIAAVAAEPLIPRTPIPSHTPTPEPSPTVTPTATETPSPTPTPTETPTPPTTATPSPTETRKPTATPTQLPPTPESSPTPSPAESPTLAATPEAPKVASQEMVTQGDGWVFENLNPELVEVGLNPEAVPRIEELMRQYGTPSIRYTIYKECPPELAPGGADLMYCVGFDDGTQGCPVRWIVEKGRVLFYPEPQWFPLLKRDAERLGLPIERHYTCLLVICITGVTGPEMLPLVNELQESRAVVVHLP